MTTTKVITMVAALAIATGAGCGEDDGGGGGAKPAAKPAAKKPAPAKKSSKGKKAEELSFIPTLERTVPEAERKKIRRRLTDRDFVATADGTGNRDPFRSFVLPLAGVPGGPNGLTTQPTAEPTEQCSKRDLIASNYPVKSLSLIGIIKKGNRRYAMFRDTGGRGHIVDLKKCIGKEKALVTEMSEDFVTYAIIPEQIPGQPLRPAIEETIRLHPDELRVEDVFDEDAPSTPPADSTAVQPSTDVQPRTEPEALPQPEPPAPPPPGGM
jgi:hypothetical protein